MIICKICGRECKNFNSLAQHIKSHHISSKEYYDKYIQPGVEHKCKFCGKPVTKFVNINVGYRDTCGIDCSRKHVFKFIDKQAKNEKTRKTKLQRYGDPNYNNSLKISQTQKSFSAEKKAAIEKKRVSTTKSHLGVAYPMQSSAVRKTWKNNYFEKTGYPHQCKNPAVRQKIKNTCLQKYRADNCSKNAEIKKKIKEIKIAKYGNQNNIQKTRVTNLIRYGSECCWGNHDVRIKCQQRYRYKNISFDSSWELAFYIYHLDKGYQVCYQPNIFFEFILEGKTHRCFPDFDINGDLYEIKGDQFINTDGTWKDPYKTHNDQFYEEKRKTLIKNNVTILDGNAIKFYLDYINDKYGKNYLQKFRYKGEIENEK